MEIFVKVRQNYKAKMSFTLSDHRQIQQNGLKQTIPCCFARVKSPLNINTFFMNNYNGQ